MAIWRGRHYLLNEVFDFQVEKGLIQSVDPPSARSDVRGGEDCWIAPGLIDLQVNGFNGYDFCSGNSSEDGVIAVTRDLTACGVTAFCPTVGTNANEAITSSLHAIARACETSSLARQRIVGIHLEGPYISSLLGPRGAHPPQYIRNPNWEEFLSFQEASGGRIKLITLAPELPGAFEFIAKAQAAGIVVAIGHHSASRDQINKAVMAGARLSTHLGNGAHKTMDRHNNYIWDQMANDALMASIIVDGHHLPPSVVKTIYRVKQPHRLILISDVIAAAGMPPGNYQLMGKDIQVMENGYVKLKGSPFQAGSTLKLCNAINNMICMAGSSFGEAICMASDNPARLLGVENEYGSLRVGSRADFSFFRMENGKYELIMTVAGGELCYSV